MTVKLAHKGTYILKGIDEPITLRQNPDGKFWYIDGNNRNEVVYVTEKDVEKQVYISRNDLELIVGDTVLYIKSLWNGGNTVEVGQVAELKGVKAKVKFEDRTSSVSPDNLFIITSDRIKDKYTWLK